VTLQSAKSKETLGLAKSARRVRGSILTKHHPSATPPCRSEKHIRFGQAQMHGLRFSRVCSVVRTKAKAA